MLPASLRTLMREAVSRGGVPRVMSRRGLAVSRGGAPDGVPPWPPRAGCWFPGPWPRGVARRCPGGVPPRPRARTMVSRLEPRRGPGVPVVSRGPALVSRLVARLCLAVSAVVSRLVSRGRGPAGVPAGVPPWWCPAVWGRRCRAMLLRCYSQLCSILLHEHCVGVGMGVGVVWAWVWARAPKFIKNIFASLFPVQGSGGGTPPTPFDI